ncbi:hypothetical protein BDV12DRAFT_160199 [Aspergillus spectabilis]
MVPLLQGSKSSYLFCLPLPDYFRFLSSSSILVMVHFQRPAALGMRGQPHPISSYDGKPSPCPRESRTKSQKAPRRRRVWKRQFRIFWNKRVSLRVPRSSLNQRPLKCSRR